MDKIKDLVSILKRMNAGETIDSIKEEAHGLLEQIDATELSLAEQKLIEDGMKPEDLRGLCVIHMEMLKGELDKLKAKVTADHPLRTFIVEHDKILVFLEKLDKFNARIQNESFEDISEEDVYCLKNLAESLLAAENHHLREENALFPELEAIGISGPPRIMRMEHDELRAKKRMLLELTNKFNDINKNEFKKELNEIAKFIVFNLRDHIFKENHILYPSALENLKGENKWQDIKKKCDTIGYCPFTPEIGTGR